MEPKPKPAQDAKWAKRYSEILKQSRRIATDRNLDDNSSLAQPPAYEEVPTVFSTSAGDEPTIAD